MTARSAGSSNRIPSYPRHTIRLHMIDSPYAKNSPTNYLDPSGHSSTSTCRVYRDDVCVVVRPNVHSANYYTYLLERDYGITLSNEKGTWSFKNITNLLGALIEMDNALPGISRFTSGTIFYFYSNSKFYGGKVVTNDSITFHSPESGIPYQTYWHEVWASNR